MSKHANLISLRIAMSEPRRADIFIRSSKENHEHEFNDQGTSRSDDGLSGAAAARDRRIGALRDDAVESGLSQHVRRPDAKRQRRKQRELYTARERLIF